MSEFDRHRTDRSHRKRVPGGNTLWFKGLVVCQELSGQSTRSDQVLDFGEAISGVDAVAGKTPIEGRPRDPEDARRLELVPAGPFEDAQDVTPLDLLEGEQDVAVPGRRGRADRLGEVFRPDDLARREDHRVLDHV